MVQGRSAEPEPGAGVDDETGGGGGLAAGLFANAGLPAGAHGVGQALGEVGAGPADLVLDVALHGALGDTDRVGDHAGALELTDEVAHLRARGFRDGAGERPLHGAVQAIGNQTHGGFLQDRLYGAVRADHPARRGRFLPSGGVIGRERGAQTS